MKKISLNYDWTFKTNKRDEIEIVNIPHPGIEVPVTHLNLKDLEIISTYEKDLIISEDDLKNHLELLFEGAAHYTEVYLNEMLILTNTGGYIPFSVVIEPKIGINKLKVIVDSHENKDIPPFGGVVDYACFAGLYREVYLIKKPKNHITDITVTYDKPLINDDVNILIETNTNQGLIEVSLLNNEKELILTKNVEIEDYKTNINLLVNDKELWDINNSYLYHLEIKFEESIYKERFGIREALFKNDGFYLNGKKLKLMGLNRHQSYPYYGYAMPKGVQREDVLLLKDLGLNIVRTSHYPQSKHFLDACDELGLLVFEEIPGWQHIGNKDWQDLSLLNLEKMIKRDKNHPSIIIWGVRINESSDNHDFYTKTNELARNLDKTRPTGGVRNLQKSEFLEDVYTYNDFSHEGNNKGVSKKRNITKDVPYLITEHNGHMFPTKAYDNEIKRVEHALRHLNVINDMKDNKNRISGAIGWVFSDYQTHEEFGSGDSICHHGVLDIYRNPKTASYVYKAEGSKEPVLHVSSNMHIGEYPKSDLNKVYVFTNLDYIKLYKNDEYIKTFYPAKNIYKNVFNPPVIIDDFIGDLIHKNEGFSIKDSNRVKSVIKAVQKYGTKLPLRHGLMALYLMKKHKLNWDDGVALFYKYLSNWGTKQSDYKFEGYKDNKLVKTVVKSIYKIYDYELIPTRSNLTIEDTYDATRVVFKKVDQNGEVATYSFDPVEINLENLELIGPKIQNLNSGMLAFWAKTVNKGKGVINVKVNDKEYRTEVVINET